MQDFLAYSIFGLVTAAIYAIAASGLVVTYTTSGIFNMAHGAIGMIGAFIYWQLAFGWGWPVWLSLVLVVLVLAPLFGCGLEKYLMRNLDDATDATKLAVTIGVMLSLVGAALWIWDPQTSRPFPFLFPDGKLEVAGVFVSHDQLFVLVLCALVALGLRIVLYRTRIGLDMRAVVDNRSLVQLTGGRPVRASMTAWALGAMLASLAGILIAPYLQLSVTPLTLLVVNAYAAAVIGRLRSLPLTFLGAVIIGLAQSYAVGYLPTSTEPWLQSFPSAIPIIALFIALLVVPHRRIRGHMARRTRESFPMPSYRVAAIGAAALIGVAVVLAIVLPEQPLFSMSQGLGLGIVGLSLVPLLGYGGQISLCQMTFAGIGALVFAHAAEDGNPIWLVAAFVVPAILGALVALPAIRLSGLYLALATAAVASFFDLWIFGMQSVTIFGREIPIFEGGSVPTSRVQLPFIDTSDDRVYLVVLAAVFALVGLAIVTVRRSRYGRMLLAMRESPAACAMLGLRLTTVKLAVFSLSAGVAGLGGVLISGLFTQVASDGYTFFSSLPLLLLIMAGGVGMVSGALFGAFALGIFGAVGQVSGTFNRVSGLLPGLVGIGLAEQPNGVAADIATGMSGSALGRLVTGNRPAATGMTTAEELEQVQLAEEEHEPGLVEWEWVGLDAPLTERELELLDRGLGIGADR